MGPIDAHGLKLQGEGKRGFLPNFEGEGIKDVKVLTCGYTFLDFYCIFIKEFCENFTN